MTSDVSLTSFPAAIRYALGSEHEYEFVDGAYGAPRASGIDALVSGNMETLQYVLDPDEDNGASALQTFADLQDFIATEGPFDGVMAFSQGAGVIATLIVQNQRVTGASPFRCAIFFSGGVPYDPNVITEVHGRGAAAGERGTWRLLDPQLDGEVIDIPTAHIWGAHDSPTFGPVLRGLCNAESRSEFVHQGGHEIPGAGDKDGVRRAVLVIQRAIMRAESSLVGYG